jgi:hypothetical protein
MRPALCLVLALACAAGCAVQPRLMRGDADGAQVEYDGTDLAAATAVARNHCARYERVPRYIDTALNVAAYRCVHP